MSKAEALINVEEVPNIKQIFEFPSSDSFLTDGTYQEVVCKRKA